MKAMRLDQLPPEIAKQLKAQQEFVIKVDELNVSIIRKYTPFVERNEIERLFWQPIIRFAKEWIHYNGSSERFLRGVKDDTDDRQTSEQTDKTPDGVI